ncbi:MAG: MBOAT family protein [Lachnospiraceae bacterium]|nr:MBOAT family protein [Lachnospiraceae bacterium]
MVFSSLIFLCVFLPVMVIGYYVLPKRIKNLFLLLGSLFFYAWGEPVYIFLMLASVIGNYVFGMLIYAAERSEEKKGLASTVAGETGKSARRRLMLILAVVFDLGILIYFKYFTLLVQTVDDLFHAGLSIPEIALPIGISFYTFQGMSYVIDVYRSEGKLNEDGSRESLVQKNFINLALYISMFPQLIAGPIVRYTDIKGYLKERKITTDDFACGIERFIIGLAKKVLLANTIGEVADKIFSGEAAYMGTAVAWVGALCYTLQIFYDFAGYSDMAIGLGRIFGFRFMENFNYPYISKSITEFWRRWHISLSTWFRDYLYIPLGGNRKGNVYLHLLIVFLATGIWHGAAWGYLVWGLWHGLFMLIERIGRKKGITLKVPGIIRWFYTMLVVMFGWVLFKLEELPAAITYIGKMLHIGVGSYTDFGAGYYLDNRTVFFLIIAVLAAVPWAEVLPRRLGCRISELSLAQPSSVSRIIRRILLLLLLVVCMLFIVNSTYNPFIYFRF